MINQKRLDMYGTWPTTAPYAVVAGAGFLKGAAFAVAFAAAANGAVVVGYRQGVFTLAKTAGQAWTVGALLYWDDTAKSVTTTSTSNTLIGFADIAAGSADTTGDVFLTP